MPTVIPADSLRMSGSRILRFEGKDHGSGVSFYLVANDPHQGPDDHRHPYTETWTVLEGEAAIRIADEAIVAGTGDTVVVQPDTWHGFSNTGSSVLRIMCIHASPVMIQEERY